jgi:hypothetical protein
MSPSEEGTTSLSKMDSPRLPAVCLRRSLLPPDAGVDEEAVCTFFWTSEEGMTSLPKMDSLTTLLPLEEEDTIDSCVEGASFCCSGGKKKMKMVEDDGLIGREWGMGVRIYCHQRASSAV